MSCENPFFWQPAFWKQLPITTKACCENSKAISARYLKDATSKLMLIHTMLFSFNWPSSFGTCSSLKWLFHMLILLPLKSPDFCNFLSQKTFLHPQIRLRAKKGLSVQRDISFWMMCLFFSPTSSVYFQEQLPKYTSFWRMHLQRLLWLHNRLIQSQFTPSAISLSLSVQLVKSKTDQNMTGRGRRWKWFRR